MKYFAPTCLAVVAIAADVTMTVWCTSGDPLKEGNVAVAGLWQLMGRWSFVLPVIWTLIILAVAFLLRYKASHQLALWWLYSVFVGHLLGFLSWTPLNVIKPYLIGLNDWVLLAGFLSIVVAAGLGLSNLHFRYID